MTTRMRRHGLQDTPGARSYRRSFGAVSTTAFAPTLMRTTGCTAGDASSFDVANVISAVSHPSFSYVTRSPGSTPTNVYPVVALLTVVCPERVLRTRNPATPSP